MRTIALILFVILISSCHSTRNLEGQVYELADGEQKIQLSFLKANRCKVEQSYECEKLPDTFRYLTLEAKYNIVKQKLKYAKNKSLAVELIVLKSVEPNPENVPNITYIPDYEKLCLQPVTINSNEYKLRKKLTPGIILNFVKDSLVIKKDTIYFGYKKVPRKR
ncbi:hypothetical protein [Flavobacterium sp.]